MRHDDKLHVTNEVQGSFGTILKWITRKADPMHTVEAELPAHYNEKVLEALNVTKQTVDNEALDSGD